MSCACEHGPVEVPDVVCTVDGPTRGRDPALVVLASRCRSTNSEREYFVEIVGDLDSHTARLVEPRLLECVRDAPAVVIDMAGVSFLDSAGLRVVEKVYDGVVARQGRVWLHAPSRHVRRLIGAVGVDRFDVCEPASGWQRERRSEGRDDGREVRLVELAGGRHHPQRRRLTIDARYTSLRTRIAAGDDTVRCDVVYTVCGELDTVARSAILDREVRRYDGLQCVSVDMSGVTLIDSAGMRVIENLAAGVAADGGQFVLRNPSPVVERVLDTLDLIFDSTNTAMSGTTELCVG